MIGPHVDPDLLAAYALDALDASDAGERASIEAHLASCDVCRHDVTDLRRVTVAATLAGHQSADALPASLRARTIARATGDASVRTSTGASIRSTSGSPTAQLHERRWISPGLALAASVLLTVGLGAYALSLRAQIAHLRDTVGLLSEQTDTLRERLERERRDTAALVNTVDVLRAPDTVRIDLRGTGPSTAGATGRAFLSARGVIVDLRGMPDLPAGRVYQLWLIPPGQNPVSAGVFTVDAAGDASMNVPLPADASAAQTVAVTMEDGPSGAAAPTVLPPLLAGSATR